MNANWVDLLQWPAMAVTLLAAWLVASQRASRRKAGFWFFILSNLLWAAWGVYSHAWALIALQVGLATLNIRGTLKTAKAEEAARGEGAAHDEPAPAAEQRET